MDKGKGKLVYGTATRNTSSVNGNLYMLLSLCSKKERKKAL